MPHDPHSLIRLLAADRADWYAADYIQQPMHKLLGGDPPSVEEVRDALADPRVCLEAIYAHYAFSRRGKDRDALSALALESLERTCDTDGFDAFMHEPDASRLWGTFLEVCAEHRHKAMEQQNRGVVAGLAELAQEVYRLDEGCSIADWVVDGIVATGRIEPQFMRIVDVRGVGPKIASTLVRDLAFLFDFEGRIDRTEKLYVQPIDKWIRILAPFVIPEPDVEGMADWVLAGKLAKHTRLAGVSGIRFNMGASYYGVREVRVPEMTEAVIAASLGLSP